MHVSGLAATTTASQLRTLLGKEFGVIDYIRCWEPRSSSGADAAVDSAPTRVANVVFKAPVDKHVVAIGVRLAKGEAPCPVTVTLCNRQRTKQRVRA